MDDLRERNIQYQMDKQDHAEYMHDISVQTCMEVAKAKIDNIRVVDSGCLEDYKQVVMDMCNMVCGGEMSTVKEEVRTLLDQYVKKVYADFIREV